MRIQYAGLLFIALWVAGSTSCSKSDQDSNISHNSEEVQITAAMREVMWQGKLEGQIQLDTLAKEGMYGLGPVSFLTGEVLINDGEVIVSRVTSDSTMAVRHESGIEAPFFVHANVTDWNEFELDSKIKSIEELESYLDSIQSDVRDPFVFKLRGSIRSAIIHIVNLAPNSSVSSPEEAHKGQVNYDLGEEEVEIIGFFSRNHAGVFTHHTTKLHMHLITSNGEKMGHLDQVDLDKQVLYLPKK